MNATVAFTSLGCDKNRVDSEVMLGILCKNGNCSCYFFYIFKIYIATKFTLFITIHTAGILELIQRSGYDITGKECVVIGRSNIVGKPVAMLLLRENGTVTICHSKTKNLHFEDENNLHLFEVILPV